MHLHISLWLMSLADSLKLSKHFKTIVRRFPHFYFSNLDPVDFTKSYVTLRKYPAAWTPGNRVKIVWDPAELTLDQPVKIQIITLVLNPLGIVQARATVTVIKEQKNTGNAEFNLPDLFNERSVVSNHRCLCFQFFSSRKCDGYFVSPSTCWAESPSRSGVLVYLDCRRIPVFL